MYPLQIGVHMLSQLNQNLLYRGLSQIFSLPQSRISSAFAFFAAAVTVAPLCATADPVEVYEDNPRTSQFVSAPFFGARSLIRVEYLRGKIITPGVSRTYLSKDVKIRVINSNFSGLEKTSAVLMSVCSDRATGATRYQDVKSVQLEWDGTAFQSDRYTVVFDYTASGESYRCTQEIAVVSNDHWMTDPISGNHNFAYSMADAQ
jgi:hypothetical protein